MRSTILGSSGFIGSHLKKYLLNSNFEIVEFKELELNKIDLIIICVGTVGNTVFYEDPLGTIESNYTFPLSILKKLGNIHFAGKIFYVSTYFVYGECIKQKTEKDICFPIGTYALYKHQSESLLLEYAKEYNLNLTVLRTSNIIGNREDVKSVDHNSLHIILDKIYRNESVQLIYNGNLIRNILSIDNFAKIIRSLADLDFLPKIINIGSKNELSIHKFANTAIEIFKSSSTIILVPGSSPTYKNPKQSRIDTQLLYSLIGNIEFDDISTMLRKWIQS